jgi:hypothetical protein
MSPPTRQTRAQEARAAGGDARQRQHEEATSIDWSMTGRRDTDAAWLRAYRAAGCEIPTSLARRRREHGKRVAQLHRELEQLEATPWN